MARVCDRHGVVLDVPDSPEGDATKRGIKLLLAALRSLERDEMALLDESEKRRDYDALARVRNALGELRDRLRIARRRCAAKRLGAYGSEPEILDRVAQVEAGCGDVTRHMVDLLVAADEGNLEGAEKAGKAVTSAASRVKSLVADVSSGASRSVRTGQLALAFDEEEKPSTLAQAVETAIGGATQ